jgi:hypothetical protein
LIREFKDAHRGGTGASANREGSGSAADRARLSIEAITLDAIFGDA